LQDVECRPLDRKWVVRKREQSVLSQGGYIIMIRTKQWTYIHYPDKEH
jgi:hypothetical protein